MNLFKDKTADQLEEKLSFISYESGKILGHVDEYKKLCLISKIKNTISDGCYILGIETYPCLSKIELTK